MSTVPERPEHAVTVSVSDRRRSLRITQTQLAVIAETNQQQISRLESGRWRPNSRQAKAIARILQLPVESLFNEVPALKKRSAA